MPWRNAHGPSLVNESRRFPISLFTHILNAFTWIVIIRALLSWVRPDPHNPIIRFMDYITEPFLHPIRRLVPPEKMGGLDLSPLILIFIIQAIERFVY